MLSAPMTDLHPLAWIWIAVVAAPAGLGVWGMVGLGRRAG